MIKGAFKRFDHDHIFEQLNGKVKITDIFDYESPFSILGKMVDAMILENYMTDFSFKRNHAIKKALESGEWKKFLNF